MKLIAKWKPQLEPAYDEPSSVFWEDGTAATVNDYRTHELDTHSLHASDDGGTECHMFPEIVAEVTFDRDVRDWVVRVPDVAAFGLELNNPCAKDEQIIAGLYTFPVVYSANIIRCEPKA
jgi:hypothetical protein